MTTLVLIVGGYGVVGGQIAQILADRNPDLGILIAGRSLEAARAKARTIPGAEPIRLDLADADPLAGLAVQPDLVLAAVNDHEQDHLLTAALRRGIAYLDITRWTDRLRDAATRLLALPAPSALIVFASSWMASVPATLARHLSHDLAVTDAIHLDIVYALKDKAGPNSADYMDRLSIPFPVVENGSRVTKMPLTDPRPVDFPHGRTIKTYRLDTPDQITLPAITGARSVSSRIAFDHAFSTALLAGLVRSGLWGAISGRRFTALRRAMLYNPGPGDHHRILVEATGQSGNGTPLCRRLFIDDSQGQTHLTAAGAVIQAERILGRHGHAPAPPRPHFAEAETDGAIARRTLESLGIGLHDL
jgi:hypothetical protein